MIMTTIIVTIIIVSSLISSMIYLTCVETDDEDDYHSNII